MLSARDRLAVGAEDRHADRTHAVHQHVQEQRVAAVAGAFDLVPRAMCRLTLGNSVSLCSTSGRMASISASGLPGQQRHRTGADAQRPAAADVEVVGADRESSRLRGPRRPIRCRCAPRTVPNPRTSRRASPATGRARLRRSSRSRSAAARMATSLAERIGLGRFIAPHETLAGQHFEDAQVVTLFSAAWRGDFGQAAYARFGQRTQDPAGFLDGVDC